MMGDWTSVLNECPIDWLLEKEDPSVRYFTLVDILGKPADGREVIAAKKSIMQNGLVPAILEKQDEGGYWGKPEDFYIRSKYKGTVWTLILLAGLGADGADRRIQKACEFIMEHSQNPTGGFSYKTDKAGSGYLNGVIPCLTGNMVWSLIRLGYLDDARVQNGIDFITKYQRFDDGEKEPPAGWPYDLFEQKCYGRHTCHMGVVKALKALAAIPENKRSDAIKNTIANGAEHMLKHHIHKRSHDLSRVSKPGWLRLGYPLMYHTNILEILEILTDLGYKDKRMQEAVDVLLSKQDEHGRWKQDDMLHGRYIVGMETNGKPGKWVTLHALKVLKSYYGQ